MDASKVDKAGDDPNQHDVPIRADERAAAPAAEVEDAPDPDEDDLDDLDDMLDEFSTVKLDTDKAAAVPQPGPGRPATTTSAPAPDRPTAGVEAAFNPDELENVSDEEFQKQLQEGMAELMNDLENSPDMQAQFEQIFKGLGGAAEANGSNSQPGAAPEPSTQAATDSNQDATFQETIRRTMARMQESGDQATAAAAAGASEDDFLAEMMKTLKDLPGDGGSEEDVSKMLMGMMEQLTNKEMLYEPMKELNNKYPEWITKNKDALSKDDLKRYQEQQVHVAEMVAKFEESTYSDSNTADRQYIVERMQKMQEAGSPPQELIGDMPSAKEVLDAPDESCAPQ